MRALAWLVPPDPFATRVYVRDVTGVTEREPDDGSTPSPSMVMSVALVVCHVNTVDCPCWILSGVADRVAVGAGGGGGGGTGWGSLAVFLLLQSAIKDAAVNAAK